jgi:hypothetical protein
VASTHAQRDRRRSVTVQQPADVGEGHADDGTSRWSLSSPELSLIVINPPASAWVEPRHTRCLRRCGAGRQIPAVGSVLPRVPTTTKMAIEIWPSKCGAGYYVGTLIASLMMSWCGMVGKPGGERRARSNEPQR